MTCGGSVTCVQFAFPSVVLYDNLSSRGSETPILTEMAPHEMIIASHEMIIAPHEMITLLMRQCEPHTAHVESRCAASLKSDVTVERGKIVGFLRAAASAILSGKNRSPM